MEKNYFEELNQVKCSVEQKNGLNYVSWADAWAEVKKRYPMSTFTIYENIEGFPFWESNYGIDVKVGVTINNIEHIVRLPVLDGANKPQKHEDYEYTVKNWKTKQLEKKTCKAANQFDINKAIQRAFAKAIAMHGIGLYVYRGEDLPEQAPKEVFRKIEFKKIAEAFNEGGKELGKQTYVELDQIYDMVGYEDKIKELSEVYKANQSISEEDINRLWQDKEGFEKEVKNIK